MTDKPEEAKPEPKQTAVVDHVKIMLKALELAENAHSYKESEKGHINILVNEGKDKTNDSTLAAYIKKAEKQFILDNPVIILEMAYDNLEREIGEIRELLNE